MTSSSAPVAQLDRALPSEGRGREFESRRARHKINGLAKSDLLSVPGVSRREARQPVPLLCPLLDARSARCVRQRPRQWQREASHAATLKTAAMSNVEVAFGRILGIAALVLPIQIECEISAPVLCSFRLLIVSLKQKREIEHSVGIVWCALQRGAQTIGFAAFDRPCSSIRSERLYQPWSCRRAGAPRRCAAPGR
jgi:hypothetical protein